MEEVVWFGKAGFWNRTAEKVGQQVSQCRVLCEAESMDVSETNGVGEFGRVVNLIAVKGW